MSIARPLIIYKDNITINIISLTNYRKIKYLIHTHEIRCRYEFTDEMDALGVNGISGGEQLSVTWGRTDKLPRGASMDTSKNGFVHKSMISASQALKFKL